MPTLYFAKMIYKCKLVGVVSKECMLTNINTSYQDPCWPRGELALICHVGTVHMCVVCGT